MTRCRFYSAFLSGVFLPVISVLFLVADPSVSMANHNDPGAFVEDIALNGCNHCHNLTIVAGNFDGTDRVAGFSPGNTPGKLDDHPKLFNWSFNVNFMLTKGSPASAAAVPYLNQFYSSGNSCPAGIPEGSSCLQLPPVIPAAPSNLVATIRGWGNLTDYTTMDLTWNDNSGGDETGFRIERCIVGTTCPTFTPLTTVGSKASTS